MTYKIENESFTIKIKQKGAELCSIFHKEHQLEYLWQADPKYWARHAPVLFPIIGQVQNGSYTYDDKQYHLGQHGFARDTDFELVAQSENSLSFRLKYDDRSLLIYPFQFELFIKYTLEEDRLISKYQVSNLDSGEMYFSLGLHPAFTCPIASHLSFSDYYLEFDQVESADCLILDHSLIGQSSISKFIDNSRRIDLRHSLFDNDALIFENLTSSSVKLKSDQSKHYVEMGISGFPYLGIWTKQNTKAPFVCIEPWYGISDERGSRKSYDQKKGIQQLSGHQRFQCDTYIKIG